jgi:hypothetical protein
LDREKRACDELDGKIDKPGEYGCIDEIKLRVYKLSLNVSSRRLLLAPYIGGQV